MIQTSEALNTLDTMLAAAGFDCDHPDPQLAWRVFKEFAAIPADCAGDAVLFQVGTFDFAGESLFHFDFTRQFTFEDEGEYDGMEQLRCTIYYRPTPRLHELEGNAWSFDSASLEEFFARVEATPEFQVPIREATPLRAEIDQEAV